ncbi:Transcription activator AMTR1 [Colletotrichum sp. SAR11_240]|nr:Transcription activator AMTR1 [Colletotrichum sp. SAR11_240]
MVDRPPSPAEEGQKTRPRPHPPPPPTDPDPDQPPAKKKRTRTRTGCLNCRRKKRKCDEGRPACGGCSRRKERCEWGIKVTFRAENAQTILQDHPSMRKARRPPPRRHFEILDVTSEVIRDYHLPPGFHDYDSEPEPEPSSLSPPGGNGEGDRRKSLEEDETKTFDSPVSYTTSTAGGHTASIAGSNTAKRTLSSSGPSSAPTDPVAVSGFGSLLTPSTRRDDDTSDKGHAQTGDRMDFQASPSSASQQLLTDNAVANLIYLSQGGGGAGQGPHDHHSTTTVSGIPITTLALDPLIDAPFEFMDQMFTPEGSYEDGIFLPGSAYHELHSTLRNHLIQEVRSNGPTRPGSPASGQNSRRRSIDASSGENSSAEAPEATGEISSDHEPPFLPLEEECALWKNWVDEISPWLDKHLDGCASLMEAVGMNGFVGGVEQALFWCFARMDVCGGLISSVKTLIPVNHWASQIDLEADVGLFLSHPGHDMWANYAVYICAQVLDLLAPLAKANPGGLFFDGPRNDMRYRLLEKIEKESGWGTKWRADDLKEFWGDLGDG